jgi:hypothetical protein
MDRFGITGGFLIAQLVNIAILLIIGIFLFLLLRMIVRSLRGANTDALTTLKERLAAGKIIETEYHHMRALILDQQMADKPKRNTIELADDGELNFFVSETEEKLKQNQHG